jgi:hypothetical protein
MAKTLTEEQEQTLKPWLASIGLIIMYWSPIERHIDQCSSIIYNELGGNKIKKNKPRPLESKLEFIKKCHSKIDVLKTNLDHVEKLIIITKKVTFIRDLFVHGCVESYTKDKLEISKIKRTNLHEIEIFTVDPSRLNNSVSLLEQLKPKWEVLALNLYQFQGIYDKEHQ